MKLARKLGIALILAISGMMVLNAYLRLRAEIETFETDSIRDLRVMGRGLGSAVEAVWRHDGEERAQQFVRDVNLIREEVTLRWVPLGAAFVSGLTPKQRHDLLLGREVQMVRRDESGDERRYSYTPLSIPDAGPVALELSESLGPEHAFVQASLRLIVLTTLAIFAVCSVIVMAVGFYFVGRPMRLLAEKARRVGAGDLSSPLRLRQRDEIGELAGEINAMCEQLDQAHQKAAAETEARIAALEQLRHVDRLKTIGQLASGLAHELGTPLNVVSGHAKMIAAGELVGEEAETSAGVIAEQAERMTDILRNLLDFSRRRGPNLRDGELCELTARTIEMLAPLADRSSVRIELDVAQAEVPIHADPNQVRQALTNVLVNGVQAMPKGGRLRVKIGSRTIQPPPGVGATSGAFAFVEVIDQGNGIAAENLRHIFEPFFTTKEVGEGSGLGLAVADGIIREHGGWIAVDSVPGRGSRFSIFLPLLANNTHEGEQAWIRMTAAS